MLVLYVFIGAVITLVNDNYRNRSMEDESFKDIGRFIVMSLFWPVVSAYLIYDYLKGKDER